MKKTVVVIEEENCVRKVIEAYLKGTGVKPIAPDADVVLFDNGNDGLAYLAAHKADLVIADYAMPGMFGTEVAQFLRTDERYALNRNVPLVLLTGLSAQDIPPEKMEHITHYLEKGNIRPALEELAGFYLLPATTR
jgi:CheY-like chemotaxis protein